MHMLAKGTQIIDGDTAEKESNLLGFLDWENFRIEVEGTGKTVVQRQT